VDVRCNYYFMIASTLLMTLVGWAVTRWILEPRFSAEEVQAQIRHARANSGADAEEAIGLTRKEFLGMGAAALALLAAGGLLLAQILFKDGALWGQSKDRPVAVWVEAIVPILFVLFLIPGLAYGVVTGSIRSDRDVARMMSKTMSAMGPYVVMAFFAAQFVSWFQY